MRTAGGVPNVGGQAAALSNCVALEARVEKLQRVLPSALDDRCRTVRLSSPCIVALPASSPTAHAACRQQRWLVINSSFRGFQRESEWIPRHMAVGEAGNEGSFRWRVTTMTMPPATSPE
jgi:hypothetical protein